MIKEIKSISGLMNLDDPKDTLPRSHHREARNGVFRGNNGLMKFQSIRGNKKIINANLKTNTR
jgi:hypothetical protein